jgi:3-hydroxyacyl-CoA dehydrogenase
LLVLILPTPSKASLHHSITLALKTNSRQEILKMTCHKISEVDWIIEVVVERLDIKKVVFDQVEQHRTPGTLVSSNTSGIPIKFMNEGRSLDFQSTLL